MKRLVSDEQIVGAIARYVGEHGYSPSVRDVSEAIGISLAPTKRRLDMLRKMGVITFKDGMARTIRVVQR